METKDKLKIINKLIEWYPYGPDQRPANLMIGDSARMRYMDLRGFSDAECASYVYGKATTEQAEFIARELNVYTTEIEPLWRKIRRTFNRLYLPILIVMVLLSLGVIWLVFSMLGVILAIIGFIFLYLSINVVLQITESCSMKISLYIYSHDLRLSF